MADNIYYLKIEGVPGEVTDKVLPGSMELLSWSWSTSGQRVGHGAGGTGKVTIDELHFSAEQSKASPTLFQAATSGQHFSKAVMIVSRDSNQLLRAEMKDIIVSSMSVSGNGHVGKPIDMVAITFVDLEIRATDAKSMAFQGSGKSYSLKTAGS